MHTVCYYSITVYMLLSYYTNNYYIHKLLSYYTNNNISNYVVL